MELDKEKVKKQIEKAKEYGLSYKDLAKAINLMPVTVYMFLGGTHNLSKNKQIEALCYIDNYIAEIEKRLSKMEVYA